MVDWGEASEQLGFREDPCLTRHERGAKLSDTLKSEAFEISRSKTGER
jgi:hypothetical protein